MEEAGGEEGDASKKPAKKVKLYLGQNGPSVWREEMEVANPVYQSLSTSSENMICLADLIWLNANTQSPTSVLSLRSYRMH